VRARRLYTFIARQAREEEMHSDPISAPCHTTYMPAYRTSGYRSADEVLWVILHDTEGGTASSIASYFHGRTAGGSAHLVVDDNQCHRCLPNGVVPWGAIGANHNGLHIEHCVYACWSERGWMKHIKMLRRSAWKASGMCINYKIPARYSKAADLRAGRKGISTHAQVSMAFPGSGHTDPGPNFPIYLYIMLVRYYIAKRRVAGWPCSRRVVPAAATPRSWCTPPGRGRSRGS